jgi:hypothetical protein
VCAPAPAAAADTSSIAAALRKHPVYADDPAISSKEVARVEREIAQRDRGRIKIALVTESDASRAGGVAAMANAIDQRLGGPGTTLVNAGSRAWVVTSYADTHAAEGAVQQAFDAHHRLVDQVLESVDGIAAVDPGPERAPSPAAPTQPPAGGGGRGGGTSAAAWIVPLVVVGLPLAIWGGVFLRRRLRARAEARETFDDDLADARQALAALADDVNELDLDSSIPGADPTGKEEYEQALGQYQRAERLLSHEVSARRLAQANRSIAEGRRLMDAARQSLDRASTKP